MRIKGIFRPGDHPSAASGQPDEEISNFFADLFPGAAEPEIDRGHTGLAVLAHNPALARHFADMSRFMALDLGFSKRADLRELALHALNLRLGCSFGFESRLGAAQASGIGAELLAALPHWRTTSLFDEEQRLVVEFANAVVANEMTDDLMARAIGRFGERSAVELTALVGFWSAWAMILNAANP